MAEGRQLFCLISFLTQIDIQFQLDKNMQFKKCLKFKIMLWQIEQQFFEGQPTLIWVGKIEHNRKNILDLVYSHMLCFMQKTIHILSPLHKHSNNIKTSYIFHKLSLLYYYPITILQQIKLSIIKKNQSQHMQVLDFFRRKNQQIQPIQFIPSIQINPHSTLYVECSPSDPHTASNIVINSYPSKTNRTNLQTKIQWRRFKILTDIQHTNTRLPFITGNAYRCQPADLGYYIQAKIISYDVACSGTAQVTIGPIRLDPTVKQLIDGALYSRSLRSQVKLLEKSTARNMDMILTDRVIKFTDQFSNKQLQMGYDLTEPKIQVNPKDPTKIFLRFQKDENNKVRNWIDSLFEQNYFLDSQSRRSMCSQGSGGSSSKGKIFKGACPNKMQVQFLTRHSRDQFIFSLRAFVCKESMKNTAIIQTIQNVTEMRNPADAHKFFQYMSLKNQIYRLAHLARELEIDRDMKLKDLQQVQQTITETTTAYIQLLEKKASELNIDFNQSYSEVSIRRDEILGKKQMRELMAQNQALKVRIRQLLEEIDLKNFFNVKNNQSQIFNQTSNPFAKKNTDSYYNPSMANQVQEQPPNKSVIQLTKSYVNLLKQNQRLKQERRAFVNESQNISNNDMEHLLQSLHEQDEDPSVIIKKLKAQNKSLKAKIQEFTAENTKKAKPKIKLNQSLAYQQQQKQKSVMNQESMVNQSRQEGGSFYSANQSQINQSMTSEAGILMLQAKIKEIEVTNKKILTENDRLRKERNQYKTQYEQLKKGLNVIEPKNSFSNSSFFDPQGLKQQVQTLKNQKNGLLKRIQSLTKEAMKGDNLLERKCEELTKENNYLRVENESLKYQIQTLKSANTLNLVNNLNEGINQSEKLKKINSQLLEEIKNLKLEIERKSDPLYNSRVIELTNQVNFLKKTGQGNQTLDEVSSELLIQISKCQKQIEKLNKDNHDKDAKLVSQATLIERLMNSQEDSCCVSGKDKSYSETRNDSETNDKLRKKIKQLQQEIVMMRRSADALNRSQDMSRQMLSYNDEQIQIMKRQKQMILCENQKLSKMCERYAKDAREANKELIKWKQQAFDLMKAKSMEESTE